ncbi:MAG: efflux RND transporter periplasmic adaptor subunit [Phycisphaerae bacterium]|nr:efflux RND transporter periplasmic adaptor subunit [Phycisphaerae bacterium]
MFVLLFTAGGIYAGMRWHTTFERWLMPSAGGDTAEAASAKESGKPTDGKKQLWTCGMHPQVIQDHPGDCPICHMKLTPLVTGDAGDSGAAAAPEKSAAGGEDRKVKYWWDPMMNPPYISDKPGKSPMGMDLVPVYEDRAQSAGAAVVIDPAVVQNMGVRTAVVIEGPLQQTVRATAILAEPEPGRRDINLRVSGWIQTLYANTDGMAVKKGEPLFDLYSPDLRLAIEELITARKSADRAGLDTGGSLGQTSAALVAAAELRLQTLGLSAEQIAELGGGGMEHAPAVVTFLSPIDGHVVEKANVYNGSAVMAGQLVLRLADRSTMWFEARVPEGSIGRVRVGQRAVARVNALPGRTFEGEVVFVHPHLDEMTRTALVRMAMPNSDGVLRSAMYAIADIDVGSADPVMLIPREAVIDTGERQLVFVSTGKGRFEPRNVAIGLSGEQGLVEVRSGLKVGESVVSSGQFLIDSESRLREAIAKFLAGKSSGGVTAAPAAPMAISPAAQERVDAIVSAYLALAESLGEVQKDATPLKPEGLIASVHALHGEVSGAEGGATRLVSEAAKAAESLTGKPIDQQREAFKRVSAAVIALIDAMPPSPRVAGSLFVLNCPMAKADWVQRKADVANPYYAEDMKECGSVVRPVGGAKGAR